MSKWKVRWSIIHAWGESSDFDAETFDNFDSAKAKFYEKMIDAFECFDVAAEMEFTQEVLDKKRENGDNIEQFIEKFFYGRLTADDILKVDFNGDFDLHIDENGIEIQESEELCEYIYQTIQTNFLTADDAEKKYEFYLYDPYSEFNFGVGKNNGEARVILEKIQ